MIYSKFLTGSSIIKKGIAQLILLLALNTGSTLAQTVTLDYFFNREFRKDANGNQERFHYIWEDINQSGYSIWRDIFHKNGAQTKSLKQAPTVQNLKGTAIYIIVDPDTKKETANPNYILATHIQTIKDWVKAGGILVLLANDSANVELTHFNKLAEAFGIHFNLEAYHKVDANKFQMGDFTIPHNHPIFKTAQKVYLKEISTLHLKTPAKAVYKDGNKAIMGVSKYGKGTVFAVGDPWIYNEYCNGRLPSSYDNDKAADDLSKWLIHQYKKQE